MGMLQTMKKKTKMVETEMGKMAPKSELKARESKMAASLDKAVATPYQMAVMAAEDKAKENNKRREMVDIAREAVATPSNLPSFRSKLRELPSKIKMLKKRK